MEHVVFFPATDGNPAFRRLPSLEDAVRFVEYLRNIEDVTDVSVHALSPVPLAVRTVYRVEVVADATDTTEEPVAGLVDVVPAQPEPVAEAAEMVAEPMAEMPEMAAEMPLEPSEAAEAVPVAAEAAGGDVHSLGFFAG